MYVYDTSLTQKNTPFTYCPIFYLFNFSVYESLGVEYFLVAFLQTAISHFYATTL